MVGFGQGGLGDAITRETTAGKYRYATKCDLPIYMCVPDACRTQESSLSGVGFHSRESHQVETASCTLLSPISFPDHLISILTGAIHYMMRLRISRGPFHEHLSQLSALYVLEDRVNSCQADERHGCQYFQCFYYTKYKNISS